MREEHRTKTQMIAQVDGGVDCAALPAWNTLDYMRYGVRYIMYNDTVILTFLRSGGFVIDTGGWNTMSTRRRLNEFLPAGYSVQTYRGDPYLHAWRRGGGILFRRTITVGPRGGVKSDYTEVARSKLRRALDAYMQEYKTQGLPPEEDSMDDPWPYYEEGFGSTTMADWMKSKRRFRAILSLAMYHAGISTAGITGYLHDIDHRGGKLRAFELGRIRRYVKHCLAH